MPGADSTAEVTIARLRAAGYVADKVEVYDSSKRLSYDCFGFGDVLAFHLQQPPGSLIVQTTSLKYLNQHYIKMTEKPGVWEALRDWLYCGNRCELWGWSHRVPTDRNGNAKIATSGNPYASQYLPTCYQLQYVPLEGVEGFLKVPGSEIDHLAGDTDVPNFVLTRKFKPTGPTSSISMSLANRRKTPSTTTKPSTKRRKPSAKSPLGIPKAGTVLSQKTRRRRGS